MTDKTRIAGIVATVEALADRPLNGDEGVLFGRSDREVNKALVCWMATRDALSAAERAGAELVIAHESLFYPYNARIKPGEEQDWEQWQTNRQRREILERADMTVLRIHGSADRICIFDVFAEMLRLGKPVLGKGYHKVYEIQPTRLNDLVARVKGAVGFRHVRVSCADADLHKKVHRVGLPWGGLGLFVNVAYQQWLLKRGCDVLIAGESDSYGFRFSAECGVPMIETSHEASEIPGLRKFTDMLAEKHPDVAFEFFDNGNAWRCL